MTFIKTPNIDRENINAKHERQSIFKECKGLWGILLIAGTFMASTLIGSKFSQPLMDFTCCFSSPFGIIMLVLSIIILTIGVTQNGILVLLLFVTAACRGIGNIKITAKLNERISINSKYRATINSIKSLLFRLIYAIVIFCMGFISDYNIYGINCGWFRSCVVNDSVTI